MKTLKNYAIGLFICIGFLCISCDNSNKSSEKVLRHIVLLKFKDSASQENIAHVAKEFAALPSKIKEIKDFEWGTDNSSEGLDKGFSHSFLVTFASEEDRAVYLPHPDHQAFVAVLQPHLDDVLVLDYWTED